MDFEHLFFILAVFALPFNLISIFLMDIVDIDFKRIYYELVVLCYAILIVAYDVFLIWVFLKL